MASNLLDTGIECIGKIPEGWTIKKIKLFSEIFGRIGFRGYTVSDLVDEGEGAITLSPSNIENQKLTLDKVQYLSWFKYEESPEIKIFNNDILLVKTASVGKVAFVENLNEPATINPQLVVFKNIKINPKYFYYCLVSPVIQTQIELTLNGGVVLTLTQENIGNYYCAIPEKTIQECIVNFLDNEINLIDDEISKLNFLISEYKEFKESLISEIVTTGLHHDITMKDSYIDWIGNIPENWKIMRAKYLFKQRNQKGNNIKSQLLSSTQKFGVIPQELYEQLTGMVAVKIKDDADLSSFKCIHKNDYCISLRSFEGGFEFCEYEGVVSPAYSVFYPIIDINTRYYKYLFKEYGFIENMNSYCLSLRDGKNIPFEDFENTYIPYPPLETQNEIATYLDYKCNHIDSLINEKEKLIDQLEEYKKSLIFEYITGKKEVPK